MERNIAKLLVECLENEGVQYVFGIPGEENIRFIDALNDSSIRFILVRHEQGASFMADMFGRLTGRAGVCAATLGPGAINLLLGTADAFTDSVPMVSISAQVGLNRVFKESHQVVDLPSMFRPITKYAAMVTTPQALPEMVRKAFKEAETPRPGACYLAIPEDIEQLTVPADLSPLPVNVVREDAPSPMQIKRAANVLEAARTPIILVGHGAARSNARDALIRFSERLQIPAATTFHGKGVFPDDHPNALGAMGFMRRDYVNFGFEEADVLVCVGYDLQEFDPIQINPHGDKRILHIQQYPAEVDAHYSLAVGIEGSITLALDALSDAVTPKMAMTTTRQKMRTLLREELQEGAMDQSFPMKPTRMVSDIRKAMGPSDIALVDTGAVKMWMARLYPTYQPNTCILSNGLSTMAFALPGAIGAKLAKKDRHVLAVCGDAGFLMNAQEIETALRERVYFTVLVWVDDSYGLIKWKMDLELGHHSSVDFHNPDFVKFAESFGAKGYNIREPDDLLPTLTSALSDETVSVIACPVDYSENIKLTTKLGNLTEPI